MRWSKATNITGSSGCGPSFGYDARDLGGGVVKVQVTVLASLPPPAEVVPAGISTVYFVAMGKRAGAGGLRGRGSNASVFVPIQRHLPAGCGDSLTGTPCAARSARPVNATIGWLKVTFRLGASGTSPSGV